MSSPGFDKAFRPINRPNERIEFNNNGDALKKYNGTPTSWPTYSKVQSFGQSHSSQQAEAKNVQINVEKAFKSIF